MTMSASAVVVRKNIRRDAPIPSLPEDLANSPSRVYWRRRRNTENLGATREMRW